MDGNHRVIYEWETNANMFCAQCSVFAMFTKFTRYAFDVKVIANKMKNQRHRRQNRIALHSRSVLHHGPNEKQKGTENEKKKNLNRHHHHLKYFLLRALCDKSASVSVYPPVCVFENLRSYEKRIFQS